MLKQPVVRRVVVPATALAFGNLALLGLLIGWVGASRAYSVGPHTLLRDHLASVVFVLVMTAVLAGVVGRRFQTKRELALAIGIVIATDVAAALLVTILIPELGRHPELARAVLAETAAGLQIVAVALGAATGYVSTRTPRR